MKVNQCGDNVWWYLALQFDRKISEMLHWWVVIGKFEFEFWKFYRKFNTKFVVRFQHN